MFCLFVCNWVDTVLYFVGSTERGSLVNTFYSLVGTILSCGHSEHCNYSTLANASNIHLSYLSDILDILNQLDNSDFLQC